MLFIFCGGYDDSSQFFACICGGAILDGLSGMYNILQPLACQATILQPFYAFLFFFLWIFFGGYDDSSGFLLFGMWRAILDGL